MLLGTPAVALLPATPSHVEIAPGNQLASCLLTGAKSGPSSLKSSLPSSGTKDSTSASAVTRAAGTAVMAYMNSATIKSLSARSLHTIVAENSDVMMSSRIDTASAMRSVAIAGAALMIAGGAAIDANSAVKKAATSDSKAVSCG